MTAIDKKLDIICRDAPGAPVIPSRSRSERHELTPGLQKFIHVMGPFPKRRLETLADLGLSDVEIGRYLRIPCRVVTNLREVWHIDESA